MRKMQSFSKFASLSEAKYPKITSLENLGIASLQESRRETESCLSSFKEALNEKIFRISLDF